MKRGLSTGKPTKQEAARIVAAKEGPCVACVVWHGRVPSELGEGCDYHHTKSGNIRRGHMFGFALCPYHHRGLCEPGMHAEMREALGPSLMDGSKLFHETYGDDQFLIDLQTAIIEGR